MFDKGDALLVVRAVVLGVSATAIAMWLAATLGLVWRLLMVAGGG